MPDFSLPAGMPKMRRASGDMAAPNTLRTFRIDPTTVSVQIRTASAWVTANVSIDDAEKFAAAIVANAREARPATIEQIEAESMAQVVARIGERDVTRRELSEAFKKVAPTGHWKNPINKLIAVTKDERELVREAVVFFTGSVPEFEHRGNVCDHEVYRVTAAGYFTAIGP